MMMAGLLAHSLASSAEAIEFHNDNVLGTSMQLRIDAEKSEASIAQQNVINEIKRLENIYSSYDPNSELMQIRSGNKKTLSTELQEMVELCQHWQKQLPMAFSCRLGEVIAAWNKAEKEQARPDRKEIRALARKALYSEYDLTKDQVPQDFKWEFSAIAKGYIIDQALNIAKASAPSAKAIMLNIGGDIAQWQGGHDTPWKVSIANPNQLDDSQSSTLGKLTLANSAIAYSGHNARSRKIGRREYSHILQARDGWPRDFPHSAIVIAKDATTADASATALSTMAVSEAIDWVESQDSIEALLIDKQGRQYASTGWNHNGGPEAQEPLASIHFSLPKIRSGNYRKPYVALWIENSKRKVVKNLLLLGDSERWMSKNSLWWRRLGRKEPNLLDIMARPTRRAGQYSIEWQGLDDFGKPLSKGKYQLIIEAAREHGGHEKISIPFELGKPLKLTEKGQKEIQHIELTLRPTLVANAELASN